MAEQTDLYRACLDNIRNQFTPGYKCSDIFGALESTRGRQLRIRFSQGCLRQTNAPYDVAIQGEGFFPLANGLVTRAGSFQYDPKSSELKASDGSSLLGFPVGAAPGTPLRPIQIPRDMSSLELFADGRVDWVLSNGDGKAVRGYQIQLVQFSNCEYGLLRQGAHFRASKRAGEPRYGNPGQQGLGVLAQGYLELSNANILEQRVAAETLRRYAGVVGFPPSTELWDQMPPSSPAPTPVKTPNFADWPLSFPRPVFVDGNYSSACVISSPLYLRLQAQAIEQGRPLKDLLDEAVENYTKSHTALPR